MPTIPTNSALTGGGTPTAQKATSSTLGKDDFLKLMTTQLRRQDPMNPVDDTAFLAQMAQFTSLEQLTNIGVATTQALHAQGVSQALQLAGQSVDYVDADGNTHTGVVDSVVFDRGIPFLTISGVPGISPGAVSAVHGPPGPAAPSVPAASGGSTTTSE